MDKQEIIRYYEQIREAAVLCRSCGMCAGVCPTDAVTMEQNEYSQYIPKLNADACLACGKCMRTCTARRSSFDKPSVMGPYREIYLVRATDPAVQEASSSGGAVTALLQFGLQTGVFDRVVTPDKQSDPVCAQADIKSAITADDAGSKYVCAPLGVAYDASQKAHTAMTVLPCQAQSIRKADADTFLFGLFCSKLSTPDLIRRMARNNRTDDIVHTGFREGLWPGYFRIRYADGTDHRQSLNRSEFSAVYNSYLYACQGCLLCDDYFAECADLSCGDPWGLPQYCEGYVGQTVVIVRSARAAALVKAAMQAGVIEAEPCRMEQVLKGHLKEVYHKKTAIAQRLAYAKGTTDGLADFDTRSFIDAPSSEILNRFAIRNTFTVKQRGRYPATFRQSKRVLFVKRFAHAYLLKQFIKRNGLFDRYQAIAQHERTEET